MRVKNLYLELTPKEFEVANDCLSFGEKMSGYYNDTARLNSCRTFKKYLKKKQERKKKFKISRKMLNELNDDIIGVELSIFRCNDFPRIDAIISFREKINSLK